MPYPINILEIFRKGKVGPVELGMTKAEVTAYLGTPEDWWRHNAVDKNNPYTLTASQIWTYGGVEFYWRGIDPTTETLIEISFKPHYLHWHDWAPTLDRWIFRKHNGPKIRYLKSALKRESIPFQDTGLEIILPRSDNPNKLSYVVVPLRDAPADYDSLDVFGTIVLKSGIHVRYGDDNYIIKVAIGNRWVVKGGEQHIKW